MNGSRPMTARLALAGWLALASLAGVGAAVLTLGLTAAEVRFPCQELCSSYCPNRAAAKVGASGGSWLHAPAPASLARLPEWLGRMGSLTLGLLALAALAYVGAAGLLASGLIDVVAQGGVAALRGALVASAGPWPVPITAGLVLGPLLALALLVGLA